MRKDVSFYMDGTVEGRVTQMSALDSPLRLERKIEDIYTFEPKNKA